jgi:lysyl-tRNA synthetase class 2
MLEFYQAYSDYKDLMDLTEKFFPYVAQEVNGTTKAKFGEKEFDFADWQRLSMREAIVKYWPEAAGAKPQMSDFASHASVDALVKRFNAAHSHMPYDPKDPKGKTIATLFETVAEEHLVQPTILYDFPLDISPLSKPKPDEPEWVERFEVFIGGLEVGNAFSELNDPLDQLRRFDEQVAQKERGDEEAMSQVDHDYVRALSYGMPPAAGYGVGIDRLTMLLTDSKSIRDVILFPLLRPQTKAAEDAEDGEGKN